MATWIALLRGINVGGRHALPMRDLVAAFEESGCTNVRTYIQSGNVVFEHSPRAAATVAKRTGTIILQRHGFAPAILLLSVKELEDAVTANPFPDAERDPKSLHLYFLAEEAVSPNIGLIHSIKTDTESCVLLGKVFYLHAPGGIGRSRLAARAEKLIGVEATGRNWRTVSRVLEMAKPAT